MEIVGEDASLVFRLSIGEKAMFGRGSGLNTDDRTVSRHHVVFELKTPPDKRETKTEPRVSFVVIGQNPVWVRSKKDGEIRVLRKTDKGEFEVGDEFCLSGKIPFWFNWKKSQRDDVTEETLMQIENEVSESFGNKIEFEDVDVSGIDPVKEFGFVVMGHEFDRYPRHVIRNVKDWDWFLEEPKKNSDDEEEYEKKKRNVKAKRRKGQDNEDEEWTGASAEDEEVVGKKIRKSQVLKYNTRSKDSKGVTEGRVSRNPKQEKVAVSKDVEEDEEDVTLGGFIVDDEEEEDKQELDEDEEEEEFEEDDDDEMEE